MADPLDDIQTNSPDLTIPTPIPDDSNLPITSNAPPQSPTGAAMAQMQAGQQPQRSNQPPVPVPILQQLISGMIHPPQTAPDAMGVTRPVSRVSVMESFLGNFVQALGAGLAASGHGPGAFSRGMGAAMTAPYQQSLQQFQLGQQTQANQADIAQRQAQTQLTQKQADLTGQMATINIPGMGPMTIPVSQLGNILKGSGAAAINTQGRISIEQFKAQLAAGQVARTAPGTDPQTGQQGVIAYNKNGQSLGILPGAIDPRMLPTQNTTQQWLPDGNGGFTLASKTSNSGKVAPGPAAGTPAAPGAAPSAKAQLANRVPALAGRTGAGRQIFTNTPGIALDPTANELVQTTAAEAAQKGFQNFSKATGPEFDKYRSAQAQFNDVQTNTSRYTAAANRAVREGISTADYANIHSVMNTKGLYDFNVAISEGGHIDLPLIGGFSEAASRAEKSGAYEALSPAAKDLVDGYFRTVSSVPAYMKALTNVGKFNKEQMELEIQNIPNPSMAPGDISRKLSQWQENIDAGVSSVPRIKGMATTRDIRAKYEGGGQSGVPQPPSRATVQQMMQSLGGSR